MADTQETPRSQPRAAEDKQQFAAALQRALDLHDNSYTDDR